MSNGRSRKLCTEAFKYEVGVKSSCTGELVLGMWTASMVTVSSFGEFSFVSSGLFASFDGWCLSGRFDRAICDSR